MYLAVVRTLKVVNLSKFLYRPFYIRNFPPFIICMGAGKLAAAMQSPSRKPSKVIAGLLKSSMIPVQHVISDSAMEDSQENPGKNGTTTGGILNVTKTSLGRVLRRKGTHFC